MFADTYNRRLAAIHMPSGSLLNRGRREFEGRRPTMLAVKRVESLAAEQHTVPVKRQRVLDGLQAAPEEDSGQEAVPGFGPAELWHHFACFEVLTNMWGVAGCFKIQQGPSGEEVLYCHWQDAYDYMMEFKERAEEVLGCFSEEAVLHYVKHGIDPRSGHRPL